MQKFLEVSIKLIKLHHLHVNLFIICLNELQWICFQYISEGKDKKNNFGKSVNSAQLHTKTLCPPGNVNINMENLKSQLFNELGDMGEENKWSSNTSMVSLPLGIDSDNDHSETNQKSRRQMILTLLTMQIHRIHVMEAVLLHLQQTIKILIYQHLQKSKVRNIYFLIQIDEK